MAVFVKFQDEVIHMKYISEFGLGVVIGRFAVRRIFIMLYCPLLVAVKFFRHFSPFDLK